MVYSIWDAYHTCLTRYAYIGETTSCCMLLYDMDGAGNKPCILHCSLRQHFPCIHTQMGAYQASYIYTHITYTRNLEKITSRSKKQYKQINKLTN